MTPPAEFEPAAPDPDQPPAPQPGETHWGPAEEEESSLWWLAAAPAVWMAHLLATYATAAIWCAKCAGDDPGLGPVRWAIVAYTALALFLIGAVAAHGLYRRNLGVGIPPHDYDSPADRHRFLGLATVLLAGISAVAVVYVALAVALVATCR